MFLTTRLMALLVRDFVLQDFDLDCFNLIAACVDGGGDLSVTGFFTNFIMGSLLRGMAEEMLEREDLGLVAAADDEAVDEEEGK